MPSSESSPHRASIFRHGINRQTVYSRVGAGWSLDKALTTPVTHKNFNTPQGKACPDCHIFKDASEYPHLRRNGAPSGQCNQCRRDHSVSRYRQRRVKVLEHYGGSPPRCAHCGITQEAVLDVDHIFGGGNQDRGRRENRCRDIIQAGFPPLYQILCRNCNWLKYIEAKDT